MTERLLESDAVTLPSAAQLEAPELEPSMVVDARVQRLAHATLLAGRSAPSIGPWESSIGAALIASYAAYVVAQIFRIFWRVI
jgi:hypothetical protein